MHIDQKELKRFLKLNRKYWKKQDSDIGNVPLPGEICCITTRPDLGYYFFNQGVAARKLQEKEGLQIASVMFERDQAADEIFGSFGISSYILNDIWIPGFRRCLAGLYVFFIVNVYRNRRGLSKVKYRGVKIGDVLFDSMLRVCADKYGDFEIKKPHLKAERQFLYELLLVAERSYQYLIGHKPKYIISQGVQGPPGIFCLMGLAYGASYVSNYVGPVFGSNRPFVKNDSNIYEDFKIANLFYGLELNCLKKQDANTVSDEDVFVVSNSDGKELDRDDIQSKIGIVKNQINVLILPHGLSDSPRLQSTKTYYFDYYEWLIDTMEEVSHIKGVNWIIKDHPESKAYNQDRIVEEVFGKYSSVNPDIYMMDRQMTGDQLKKIADVVLTDSGDAGCEYAAVGIPTVVTGNTFYTRFGVGINPKTKKEYHSLLKKISDIKKPDEDEIGLARKLMKNRNNGFSVKKEKDPYLQLMTRYYRSYCEQLKKGPNYYIDNSKFYSELADLLEEYPIMDTYEMEFVDCSRLC